MLLNTLENRHPSASLWQQLGDYRFRFFVVLFSDIRGFLASDAAFLASDAIFLRAFAWALASANFSAPARLPQSALGNDRALCGRVLAYIGDARFLASGFLLDAISVYYIEINQCSAFTPLLGVYIYVNVYIFYEFYNFL
jgi:hypothetical protein